MRWQGRLAGPCVVVAALAAGDFSAACLAQQQDQDDQGNRNADQPKKNGHVVFLSRLRELWGGSAAPCAVAEAATFCRGEAGAKRSDEQGCRQPER
jgi:hypothetical protein